MGDYIVSARKYRPSTFSTVVGQQALAHTLKSAISSGRLAHAYLFCGPRGVGKTSCARIFAKTINCSHLTADGEACGECESCRAFEEQRSYNVVELDAASNNSVDDMRNLIDQVRIPPQIGKYKVYIIDEVHMLSQSAFNAFLKTLEEPPAHAIFVLATTEKHKILPTILSRCQIYDFSRITVPDIVEQLKRIAANEGITAEPEALNIIAQKADGAMRDALSIFDQVAASSMGNITYRSTIENLNVLDYEYYFRLTDAIVGGDVSSALLTYHEIREHGFDSQFFINGLADHFRNLLVALNPATLPLLEVASEVVSRYQTQAATTPVRFLYAAMDLCNQCDLNYRTASNKQFLVELTLIKLCQLLSAPTPTPTPGGGLKKVSTTSQPASASAPSPTATAAPAPAPTATATTATSQRRPSVPQASPAATAAVGGIPVISIRNINKPVAEVHSQPVKPAERRNMPFTSEQVRTAWAEYINEHPNEVFLINSMRSSLPVIDGTNLSVPVDNIAQQESIGSHMDELLGFFRDRLQNDMITIGTHVREHAKRQRLLSPEEIVAEMMVEHDSVRELVNRFKLGIA